MATMATTETTETTGTTATATAAAPAGLEAIISSAVSGLGFELVDFQPSARARLLRIFIDRPPAANEAAAAASSVNVEDCVAVSQHLSRLFAVENIDYDRLEVSSPGLDRPLKKAADFARFTGQRLHLKLRAPQGEQRNFSGVIVASDDVCVRVDTGDAVRDFAHDDILKARLAPQF